MNLFKPWITVVIILLSLLTNAQEKSKRLYVGDKVPDLEFKGMYNYPKKTAKLSDFKGKAVILDFWNKACKGCIAAFPKLEKIQEEFKDDLVVLLINHIPEETREALDLLFKNSPIMRSTTLPMVLGDENYKVGSSGFFPHAAPLYHVWIDKNGNIQATTSGIEATRENIQKLVKGEKLDVVKSIHVFDKRDDKTSWLSYNNGQFLDSLLYYKSANFTYRNTGNEKDLSSLSTLKLGERYHSMLIKSPSVGNYVGSSSGVLTDTSGNCIGGYINSTIISHYRSAYDIGEVHIVIEDDISYDANKLYVYEYTNLHFVSFSQNKDYKQDLENFFGYRGTINMYPVESYILYRTSETLKLGTKGREPSINSGESIIVNRAFSYLLHSLKVSAIDRFGNRASVIDETGIDQKMKVDITLYSNLQNLSQLNKELSKYGLGIKKELRLVKTLVLKKTNIQ